MQGYTDVVIEVNPRHVRFYKRMLGFVEFGAERMCSRVDAPAVLLRLELDYVDRPSSWGQSGSLRGERSLYPCFFATMDEVGIARRLARGE